MNFLPPTHLLSMRLGAAENELSKWEGVAVHELRPGVKAWARRNAAEARVKVMALRADVAAAVAMMKMGGLK